MNYGFCIYMHTSPSGKSYIGYSSYTIDERFKQHVNESIRGSDTIFHKALRKHDADRFESIILEDNIETHEKAKELEKYYIKKYDTFNPNKLGSNGYNMTPGGDGVQLFGEYNGMYGKTHSEEAKSKISEANTGNKFPDEAKIKLSKERTGVKRSIEHAKKIRERSRETHCGIPKSDEHRKKLSDALKNKPLVLIVECNPKVFQI